jgi:hypothetical protein
MCVLVVVLAGCGGGSAKGATASPITSAPTTTVAAPLAATTVPATTASSAVSSSGTAGPGSAALAVVGEAPFAWAALKLFAVSQRPSPQVQPAPPPAPAPGDTGYYGCTKLSADDFAAAVGQGARGPRPNGGKAASGNQPAYSNCSYQTDTTDPAITFRLGLTVGSYPSADAATQALYQYYGDTPTLNMPGIADGAFIFPNGTPAYVAVGADVVELDLNPPQGTDTASLYMTLMRAIDGHATNPAPTPTAPVPGPNDLDPCLLTPAEVQAIFQSGPVTVQRVFADNPADFACSYLLVPSLQYSIVIDTVSYAALAANANALQDRYAADRKSFSTVTDIPGFALPSAANAASGFADLWGFGDNSYVEIADHGPLQNSGGSGSTSSHPIPPTPLLNFPDPIPNQGYLASIIPTPGLTPSSICGTSGIRCAAD